MNTVILVETPSSDKSYVAVYSQQKDDVSHHDFVTCDNYAASDLIGIVLPVFVTVNETRKGTGFKGLYAFAGLIAADEDEQMFLRLQYPDSFFNKGDIF